MTRRGGRILDSTKAGSFPGVAGRAGCAGLVAEKLSGDATDPWHVQCGSPESNTTAALIELDDSTMQDLERNKAQKINDRLVRPQ
jgi:hypothetical protein